MATKMELAKSYAERIKGARNAITALAEIETEINNLVYTETNKPVTDQFKLDIYEEIKRLISEEGVRKSFSVTREDGRICEATDNSSIITTINTITNKLKGK